MSATENSNKFAAKLPSQSLGMRKSYDLVIVAVNNSKSTSFRFNFLKVKRIVEKTCKFCIVSRRAWSGDKHNSLQRFSFWHRLEKTQNRRRAETVTNEVDLIVYISFDMASDFCDPFFTYWFFR